MLAIDGQTLHPEVQDLATAANFAAVTTLLPDGHPQTQITWVDTDGDHVLINTPAGSQKARNASRDPRITITVWDRSNLYVYAEVRGEVTEIRGSEEAAEHIQKVARRHFGGDYPAPHGRALLVVTARRQLLARPPAGARR
jgi:PPOX class probable F420-dependent enzyme